MPKTLLEKTKIAGLAVLILIGVVVVLQNTQDTETHILFLTLTMPNAALLAGTLVIGLAIGLLASGCIKLGGKRLPPA